MNVCAITHKTRLPPCVSLQIPKYSYLRDFLNNETSMSHDKNISHIIKCINVNDGIEIKENSCISCMYCLFTCPENRIKVKKDLSLIARCSNFEVDKDRNFDITFLSGFFNGELVNLPKTRLPKLGVHYKTFEDFTSVDETKNISVWGAGVLRFLMQETLPRVALEVGMQIASRDRGGRLDIVTLSKNRLFVAEAKVSFKKMIEEGRYLAQLTAYENELSSIVPLTSPNVLYNKFLLIGGPESDLLPDSHPECTSNVGHQSKTFYKNLLDHELFFISANALLCLGLLKVFKGNDYSLDLLAEKIFQKDAVGLLSNGIIVHDGHNFRIRAL
jgi:NAD-dependent dihydropyrimidine dehydrogenase PreA subunit